jgi:hypothetical protein
MRCRRCRDSPIDQMLGRHPRPADIVRTDPIEILMRAAPTHQMRALGGDRVEIVPRVPVFTGADDDQAVGLALFLIQAPEVVRRP